MAALTQGRVALLEALSTNPTGTSAVTLAALTSTASGTETITGTSTPTLGALTSTASGAVTITGTATITLMPLTSSASGTMVPPGVTGTTTVTLRPLTSAASGIFGNATTYIVTVDVTMVTAVKLQGGLMARCPDRLEGAAVPSLAFTISDVTTPSAYTWSLNARVAGASSLAWTSSQTPSVDDTVRTVTVAFDTAWEALTPGFYQLELIGVSGQSLHVRRQATQRILDGTNVLP